MVSRTSFSRFTGTPANWDSRRRMKSVMSGAENGDSSVDQPSQLGTKGVVSTPASPMKAPKSTSAAKSLGVRTLLASALSWALIVEDFDITLFKRFADEKYLKCRNAIECSMRQRDLRKSSLFLLLLLVVAVAQGVRCAPQKQYGEFKVSVGNQGVLYLSYLAHNISGHLVIWGPGWSWDIVCSWQPNWPPATLEGNTLHGYLTCNYGNLTWEERFWLLDDAVVLEYELAAASNVTMEDIAWQWGLPIESFMGSYVTAITSEGFLRNVTLRPEHIPGQAGLAWYTGVGWIVPLGPSAGVVVIGLSDSRSFVGLTSTDEREWGGTTYTTRLYFNSGRLTWKPGNRIKGAIYIFPYTSREELGEGLKRANSVIYLIRANAAYSDIVKLLVEGRVVEEAERMESQRKTMLITYAAVVVALIAAVAAVLIIRHRRR